MSKKKNLDTPFKHIVYPDLLSSCAKGIVTDYFDPQ